VEAGGKRKQQAGQSIRGRRQAFGSPSDPF